MAELNIEWEDGLENNLISLPESISNALEEIAYEYKINLLKDTYHVGTNKQLRWFKNNRRYILDFVLSIQESVVTVIYYIDIFPFIPKVWIWCIHYIPGFFYLNRKIAKSEKYEFSVLPLSLSKEEYKRRIIMLLESKEIGF